ncbi:MAG: hypothetical protein ACOH2F_04935 [Cellulomonas sp.]
MSVTTEFLREIGLDLSEREFVDLLRTAIHDSPGDAHPAVTGVVVPDSPDVPGVGATAVRKVTDWGRVIATSRTIVQVAVMLGCDPSWVRQQIADGRLYALSVGRSRLLPDWQFEANVPIPGLPETLAVVLTGRQPLEVVAWMTTPLAGLTAAEEAVSPRAWLVGGGDPRAVVGLARGLHLV